MQSEHGPHSFRESGKSIAVGLAGMVVTFSDGCKRTYWLDYLITPEGKEVEWPAYPPRRAAAEAAKSEQPKDALELALVRVGGAP